MCQTQLTLRETAVKSTRKHNMGHLVSDEELDCIWREYRASIWVPAPLQASLVDDDEDQGQLAQGPMRGLNDFPLDAGVERWGALSADEIKAMFLIPAGGLPGTRLTDDGTPTHVPMWHQWVGVIEMIDRSFTSQLGVPGRPTLVADEVGMGKTAQGILFVQVLWHLKWLQDSNPVWPDIDSSKDSIRKWPPFLGQ
jgi:hypothetical protein